LRPREKGGGEWAGKKNPGRRNEKKTAMKWEFGGVQEGENPDWDRKGGRILGGNFAENVQR